MGPLKGFKVVEIAGIGPGQFCGMLLADMGAQLIRVDRKDDADLGIGIPQKFNLMNRSRPAIGVDLKSPSGVDLVLKLCEDADALFEGFRPGVMERLGLGPDDCIARNEKLVYGRMTGWGQTGPLANAVGHDGDYASLAGVIASIGERDGSAIDSLKSDCRLRWRRRIPGDWDTCGTSRVRPLRQRTDSGCGDGRWCCIADDHVLRLARRRFLAGPKE